jgi:hypothetical protein
VSRGEFAIHALGLSFPDARGVLLEDIDKVVLLECQKGLVLGNVIRTALIGLVFDLWLLLVVAPAVVWERVRVGFSRRTRPSRYRNQKG